jgi:NAD(P)-dependent dehydrogenase (short-subunit alcohol dehydrogenase family)
MEPQRVLVTAGASGIGLAIAEAFAADGARVHLGDVDAEALQRTTATAEHISGSVCDVSDPDAVQRLFADVETTLGGLDVLVNNAGIAGPTQPAEELDLRAWNAVLAVNLTGTLLVTQRAIPLLRRSGRASVIVMSSIAGRFGYPNRIAYSTTKWGLVGFTRTLSLELGPHGITANTIHPGAVQGPRIERVMQGRAAVSGRTVAEETELALANQAIRRFVDPADIAALAVFLAGPHGRSISGQAFPVDGDSKAAQ